jgi:ribosomal protein L11 methylase PrmA
MSSATVNPGSFRDPGSRVFERDGRMFRAIWQRSASAYEQLRDSGLLTELIERGMLVPSREVDVKTIAVDPAPAYVLDHDKLPFISYPYEWPFALLKRAALFHLDLQLAAVERGFTLSDATAYNVQFVATKPVFIDHLSFRPYVEGEVWAGHRQFCMQFLNPLILWSKKGISPAPWYRGSLEGISPEDLAQLLSWKDNLSWTVLTHVSGQATLQRRAIKADASIAPGKQPKLSKIAFRGILEGLRSYIAKLANPVKPTVWGDYADHNSYAAEDARIKRDFIVKMSAAVKPRQLFDIGCNSGDYSVAALEGGASSVVGFDFDYGALDAAVARADAHKLPFLPVWLDAANPSPSQGWAQAERAGFGQRSSAQALVALAFVHHIAIGRNVPIDMTIDWLISLAPTGIIEFPPKSDPMVQRLLSNREDIFPDYTEERFLQAIARNAKIVETLHITEGGRLLVWYQR